MFEGTLHFWRQRWWGPVLSWGHVACSIIVASKSSLFKCLWLVDDTLGQVLSDVYGTQVD